MITEREVNDLLNCKIKELEHELQERDNDINYYRDKIIHYKEALDKISSLCLAESNE